MSARTANQNELFQSFFSNGTKLPFSGGQAEKQIDWANIHTRWVTTAIKSGLVKDGHPKAITIEVLTSLGHMVDVVGLRWDFVIEINKDKLLKWLNDNAKTNPGIVSPSTVLDPFWGLENVEMLPNSARNMIDQWLMRHNQADVDYKDTRSLNILGMDQYYSEEAKYYATLMNGREKNKLHFKGVGGPKYIFFDEQRQRWSQKNHNAASTAKDATTGQLIYQGDNPAVNIAPGDGMDVRCNKPLVKQLAWRTIDNDEKDVYKRYYSDFYTIIALRDLDRVRVNRTDVDATNKKGKKFVDANGNNVYKTTAEIADIFGDQKLVFPMEYVIQSVYHRKMGDAVDILNFVNNPEFEVTFKNYEFWIQNWPHVGAYVDLRLENFEVLARYHDLTRQTWDREFAGKGQVNRPLVDFQWHHSNFNFKFTAGADPTKILATDVIKHSIWPQNLDAVVRFMYIFVQGKEHFDNMGKYNFSHVYHDLIEQLEWKINGEIFGKKAMSYTDMKVKTSYYYENKKSHTVMKDQSSLQNMSFDCNMNNFKGGTQNLLPIANNNEFLLTFSKARLVHAYNEGLPENAYRSETDIDTERTTDPNGNTWTIDTATGTDEKIPLDKNGEHVVKCNMFRDSLGSKGGCIKRTAITGSDPNNPQYEYEVDLIVQLVAFVPNLLTQQGGQLSAQKRLPGHS